MCHSRCKGANAGPDRLLSHGVGGAYEVLIKDSQEYGSAFRCADLLIQYISRITAGMNSAEFIRGVRCIEVNRYIVVIFQTYKHAQA